MGRKILMSSSTWRAESFTPANTTYSKESLRCPRQFTVRSSAKRSFRESPPLAGMSSRRSSSNGVCKLTARCASLSFKKRSKPFRTPTVETVIRRGLIAIPQSAVSTWSTRSSSSMLSKGSPIPMNTRLVSSVLSSTLRI